MSTTKLPSTYLTVAEVAGAMRVSKMTVYRLVQARALTSVRFGRSYRIPEGAVEEYFLQTGTLRIPRETVAAP
jgi:excisionase family DNA binding protein